MRSDMFEVIIERPRYDGGRMKWHREKARVRQDPEHAPLRGSMSMTHGTKSLNENLAPLKRFLERRVGRPWNQVYAEVSEHIAVRSAVQKHVLDHLRQYVETEVVLVDGEPRYARGEGPTRTQNRPVGLYRRSFYVCPKTGILRATPRTSRKKGPPPRTDILPIDARSYARRIDGVWYRITFAKLPDYFERKGCYDVVLKASLTDRWMDGRGGMLEREHGRRDEYAITKRQLSSRELRAIEAANRR